MISKCFCYPTYDYPPLKMFLCNWWKVQFQEKTATQWKAALFNETPKLVWFCQNFNGTVWKFAVPKVFSSWEMSTFCPKKEIRSSLWTRRKVYWYLVIDYQLSSLPTLTWVLLNCTFSQMGHNFVPHQTHILQYLVIMLLLKMLKISPKTVILGERH